MDIRASHDTVLKALSSLNFRILRAELVFERLTDVTGGVGACCGMISFAFDVDATLSTTPKPYKK